MEFSLRVGDMSFFVFCKLEIVIFKIVQVMTENIPFAFLYVLSILLFATSLSLTLPSAVMTSRYNYTLRCFDITHIINSLSYQNAIQGSINTKSLTKDDFI